MIIYNVTININHSVHDEWISWMQSSHIPEVLKTGLFKYHKMLKLLGDEDSGGVTYSIQYFCEDIDNYKDYEKNHSLRLQTEHINKFKKNGFN